MKNYLSNFRLPFKKEGSPNTEDLRRVSLNLNLSKLQAKPKGLDINPARIEQHLENYTREKTQQIQEALKYLEQLNKVELKPAVRLNLLGVVSASTAVALSDIYRKYLSKGGSFPEQAERKTDLTSCISFLRQLIQSYKYILSGDYQLPVKKFNQEQHRVQLVSVRLLELTLWLQRFLAIRFQKLSPQDWKDFNAIYFVYCSLFDAKEPEQMIAKLEIYKASGIFNSRSLERSILSIYKSVQLFGLLDITSWPSKSTQAIEQYLHKNEQLIVIDMNDQQNLIENYVVTHPDLDSAPLFKPKESSKSACFFNLALLKKQVEQELDANLKKKFIGEEEKKRIQPQGQAEKLEENQSLLTMLYKNLSLMQRGSERKSLYGSKSVDVYTGLAESYRLLYEIGKPQTRQELNSGLHDAKARSSSLLFDEGLSEIECRWQIINDSDTGLLIRTIETKYMHAMEVGHIVAIRRDEDGSVGLPQLGYITRLDRTNDGELDVAIVKMSRHAEAITILEPGQDQNTQDLLPGILIQNIEHVWQLILPRYVKYVTGTPAIIKRDTDNIPVRLGESVETKNGFIMFEVRSPVLK